jgi:RNA polymerase sigma-70 factor, ECF subfamily
MTTELPDLSLLRGCDDAAWKQAWRCLWPMALRAANHPEACLATWEAEDVANEAIVEVIGQIDSISSLDEVKALVITIAFRRAIDLSRRKFSRKRRAPEELEQEANGSVSSPLREISEVEFRELTLLVRRALDVLEPQSRMLLLEKMGDDLTYQEISDRHGIPIGTVCSKIYRSLKLVQASLKEAPLLLKELRQYLR